MREFWRDTEHLFRLAGLFAVGIVLFLVARSWLVPPNFGRDGHYRPGAVDDARARPVSFAGRAACEECHTDVVEARAGSRHARIACESCHGALAAHAADPMAVTPALPDRATICLDCHRRVSGRPQWLPQVDPVEHAGDMACADCHGAHSPGL